MFLISAYIKTARPATLLLAIACAVCGNALAFFAGTFNVLVFILIITTASLLQTLSNFANDYGDFQHGTDKVGKRIGPLRALQKGEITIFHLKKMIVYTVILTILSGVGLLVATFSLKDIVYVAVFLFIGLSAIWAAIKYTAGKNPYGYKGLGDVFTFIFFGPVGIVGAYFLQTHQIDFLPWLPSIGFGVMTVMVINVNNMRDVDNDRLAGKVTIPMMLGPKGEKYYHGVLTFVSFLCFLVFGLIYLTQWYQYLYLLGFLWLFMFVKDIFGVQSRIELVPYLKRTVLVSSLITFVFSICINLK